MRSKIKQKMCITQCLQRADAYKKFLFDYIDAKISVSNFACDPSKFAVSKPVSDIVAAIQLNKSP